MRVARETWGPQFRFEQPRFDRFFLGYIRTGQAIRTDQHGTGLLMKSHTLFSHGPNRPRRLQVIGDQPLEIFLAVAHCGLLSRCAETLFGSSEFALQVPESATCGLLFETVLREAREGATHAPQICRSYLEVLLHKAADSLEGTDVAISQAERTFRICRRYIERNFVHIRTIDEVATACAIHPVHLCRLFRQFGDHTPLSYLSRLRMQRAAHLLLNTAASIKEVAWQVGIADGFSFSRTFKRVMGESPQRYREVQMPIPSPQYRSLLRR